ncbi:hypothetical protein BDR05DRAFT_794831 [Suillus weaverae]|nr:hypothetical protein BDR05DRAFT_794831 [Suillus weaverae]
MPGSRNASNSACISLTVLPLLSRFSSSLAHFIIHVQPNELIFIAMFIISEVIRMFHQFSHMYDRSSWSRSFRLTNLFVVPLSHGMMCKFLRHADPYLILAINDNLHMKTLQAFLFFLRINPSKLQPACLP